MSFFLYRVDCPGESGPASFRYLAYKNASDTFIYPHPQDFSSFQGVFDAYMDEKKQPTVARRRLLPFNGKQCIILAHACEAPKFLSEPQLQQLQDLPSVQTLRPPFKLTIPPQLAGACSPEVCFVGESGFVTFVHPERIAKILTGYFPYSEVYTPTQIVPNPVLGGDYWDENNPLNNSGSPWIDWPLEKQGHITSILLSTLYELNQMRPAYDAFTLSTPVGAIHDTVVSDVIALIDGEISLEQLLVLIFEAGICHSRYVIYLCRGEFGSKALLAADAKGYREAMVAQRFQSTFEAELAGRKEILQNLHKLKDSITNKISTLQENIDQLRAIKPAVRRKQKKDIDAEISQLERQQRIQGFELAKVQSSMSQEQARIQQIETFQTGQEGNIVRAAKLKEKRTWYLQEKEQIYREYQKVLSEPKTALQEFRLQRRNYIRIAFEDPEHLKKETYNELRNIIDYNLITNFAEITLEDLKPLFAFYYQNDSDLKHVLNAAILKFDSRAQSALRNKIIFNADTSAQLFYDLYGESVFQYNYDSESSSFVRPRLEIGALMKDIYIKTHVYWLTTRILEIYKELFEYTSF